VSDAVKTVRGTRFKYVALRSNRRCSECRSLYGLGAKAWRPTHGDGGYARDALLCRQCMEDLTRSAPQEGS
jgi:hypothetical protein